MKIGIVCYPTFGGSGVIATELGKGLAEQGHIIHFISYDQPIRLDFFNQNLFYHDVSISKYPLFKYPPYELALTSKIVDTAEAYHLDLVHVHYAIPHAAAAVSAKQILAKKGIDLKVVTTLHGTDITLVGKDSTYEPVVSHSIDESDVVTAVSESLKRDTYANFNTKKHIDVIPNFIDFNRFNKLPKDHFKKAIAPGGEFVLIHTSNFRRVKRVGDVLDVFEKMKEQKMKVKLLLIGDGPERIELEKRCRQSEWCNDITFLGKQEAVEEILSVADLFIMPSETESFGLAALEAMACEVPVISTNAGGLPEVIEDGFCGFTCDVGDTETMAKRAIEILTGDLTQYKANALSKAKEYALANVLPQYVAIYEKALSLNSVTD